MKKLRRGSGGQFHTNHSILSTRKLYGLQGTRVTRASSLLVEVERSQASPASEERRGPLARSLEPYFAESLLAG